MRGRFGEYAFDTATRELRRAGEPLHLSPKAFDLLQTLIEARPRALSKEEILERVWTGTFVSDGTLTVVIAELRKVLGDEPREPRFIRTIQRFGYAFCAEFETAADESHPVYRLLWGTREITLSPGTNVLGRCPEAVAWINDPSISRRHALIEISPADAVIEDLGSKNGTFVGGSRLTAPKRLVDGDSITLGRVPMTFRIFQDGGPTRSLSVAPS